MSFMNLKNSHGKSLNNTIFNVMVMERMGNE